MPSCEDAQTPTTNFKMKSTKLAKSGTAELLSNPSPGSGNIISSPRFLAAVDPTQKYCIHDKVTVVGAGQVGMACAFAMMAQGITNHLALVDANVEKVKGEAWDLEHSSAFVKQSLTIEASNTYEVSKGSSLCVITAGVRQREGESRLNLVQRNVDIFRAIVPELVKCSPNCILIVVSNPVDIMTWVAWKLSGLPSARVVGSGTNLDSSRFRTFIAQKLDVSAVNTHGCVIGEHGDSSVPVWSSVMACGVRLRDMNPKAGLPGDTEAWDEVHKKVVNGAYEIIKAKGYTSWAIGMSVSSIVSNILRNSRLTCVLSVHVKGIYGINDEVYLSLPTIMGNTGLRKTINLFLTDEEVEKLRASAITIAEITKGLTL